MLTWKSAGRIALSAVVWLTAYNVSALDKQGRGAHGGEVESESEGFGVSGSLSLGVSPYNPSYAARPDNSGLALMRYAGHADIDLIGSKLSIPIDINMFSDRTRHGALEKISPSELDIIAGVTTTWNVGPFALEGSTRLEHDRSLDRKTVSQTYVDTRLRALYSLADIFPGLGPALMDGDISGWLTLGWFAYNPTYFARPDNTGLALFRYAMHTEVSVYKNMFAIGLDAIFFTDRKASNPFAPSELDLTPEIIFRVDPFEVHVAYERDMPIDRGTFVQQFVYLLGTWSFDVVKPPKSEDAHDEDDEGEENVD